MLTIEPLSPVALVKILTVLPDPASVKCYIAGGICGRKQTHSIECGFDSFDEVEPASF